ncbi:MAG: hypothetical protein Q9182_006825 [Xanthomendoza sp. 2 TL-2023]
MFLIENNRNAILYTGDIRDRIYLDTTFAVNKDPYRNFPTKAQGLSELLGEVSKFPEETILHFNAWTLGYEEVWVALAAHLNSLASSSASTSLSGEGAALCGFPLGNRNQAGCLTNNALVRLHSCELGTRCSTIETSKNIIWITPLINRCEKGNIPEIGAGGGGGDLTQLHELELTDSQAGPILIELCKDQIRDDAVLSQTVRLVEDALCSSRRTVALSSFNNSLKDNVIPLGSIASLLIQDVNREDRPEHQEDFPAPPFDELNAKRVRYTLEAKPGNAKTIVRHHFIILKEVTENTQRFPYSRHSSYTEMCHLLSTFQPKDVYPCVTDEKSWTPETSIESLFGHLCTGHRYLHDLEMRFVHDFGFAEALENSSRRSSSEKASSAATQSSLYASESSKDCIKSPLASEQLDSAIVDVSGMEYSSARLAKRRWTGEISRHKTSQFKLQGSRLGYSARHEKRVLSRSFSEWLGPVGEESLAADRTLSESSKGRNVNSTLKGEQSLASLRAPSDPRNGLPKESKSRRTYKLQGESSLSNATHQGLPHNNDRSSPVSTTDENIFTKDIPRKSSDSTPSVPLEISDTFGSETKADSDQDDTTQLDDNIY